MATEGLELVANIWPIADERSHVIQRFAARAYAMDVRDEQGLAIALQNLAQTDFYAAKQFLIPEEYTHATEHGVLKRSVLPDPFYQHAGYIINSALEELQRGCPEVVGVRNDSATPQPVFNSVRFSQNPFIIVNLLFEDLQGNLKLYRPGAGA